MTPTHGSIVLLTLISGTERILVTALVLSASPDAEGKPPLLNLAFLHPGRLDNLGSPDWRLAFDRRVSVKHESHDDVQNSAEGCFWNESDVVSTFASEQIEKLTTFLLDNHGRECTADTAVDIAIRLLGKSKDAPAENLQQSDPLAGLGEGTTEPTAEQPQAVTEDAQSGDAQATTA